jgi:hypothetical protein
LVAGLMQNRRSWQSGSQSELEDVCSTQSGHPILY